MRSAIAKRDFYNKWIKSYEAELYVKGMIKVIDAPDSFMGQDIGNMEGMIDDSTRQGIIYQSESLSTVYKKGDDIKEVMHSSFTAGQQQGFTFNQFAIANFNVYEENIRFERSLISPLNDASFSYYKFSLEGTILDVNGKLVNKIKIIPKSDVTATFSGFIYIYEDTWNIHSVDLKFTGKAIKNPFFDWVRLRQVMNLDQQSEKYYMSNQIMSFESKFFSFRFGGTFNYLFRDIDVDKEIEDKVFNSEVFKMVSDAEEKPDTFWNEIRPIPLTEEESSNIIRQDSLTELRESKTYLDSIDARNNKLGISSLLFGYDNDNTYNNRYFDISGPLKSFRFNVVEGFSIGPRLSYRKYDKDFEKRFRINARLRYGFSDKQWKPTADISYRYNLINQSLVSIGGGRDLYQFDRREQISDGWNTWNSLVFKRNFIRLYDLRHIYLRNQTELLNGFYLWTTLRYERRAPVVSNSDYSLFNKDDVYEVNNPISIFDQEDFFLPHKALILDVDIRFRPFQKYFTYPRFKGRIPSAWPTISLAYSKAIDQLGSDVSYDKLRLSIIDRNIDLGAKGLFSYILQVGTFLSSDRVEFMDNFHFLGREVTTSYFDNNLLRFKLLPYYGLSGVYDYFAFGTEHNFDGFILDKIPFVKHAGWNMIIGTSGVIRGDDLFNYFESSVGIDKLGIGVFKLFRLEYVWSYNNAGLIDHGIRIGINRAVSDIAD